MNKVVSKDFATGDKENHQNYLDQVLRLLNTQFYFFINGTIPDAI